VFFFLPRTRRARDVRRALGLAALTGPGGARAQHAPPSARVKRIKRSTCRRLGERRQVDRLADKRPRVRSDTDPERALGSDPALALDRPNGEVFVAQPEAGLTRLAWPEILDLVEAAEKDRRLAGLRVGEGQVLQISRGRERSKTWSRTTKASHRPVAQPRCRAPYQCW
jgi:hypothetical protein